MCIVFLQETPKNGYESWCKESQTRSIPVMSFVCTFKYQEFSQNIDCLNLQVIIEKSCFEPQF